MGFSLYCVFALDTDVLALFEQVVPGGSGHALRAGGPGLPDGWVLPVPWEMEDEAGDEPDMVSRLLESADLDAWRAAAGVPAEPDPLGALHDLDLQLISLLSLAAPVIVINDHTFGGVLGHEYAAVCVDGVLKAAYGIDFLDNRGFALEGGVYRTVSPASISPTAQCAELLDDRFRGSFLFDGYLPRRAHTDGPPCGEIWSGPAPAIDPAWRRHFPGLEDLQVPGGTA